MNWGGNSRPDVTYRAAFGELEIIVPWMTT